MGEARSKAQLPMESFEHGVEVGREVTQRAARRISAWAEKNPGQFLLVGLAAGFILSKLLLHKPRRMELDGRS